MIQAGLYRALTTAPTIQALMPKDSSGQSLAKECVHFVRAPKLPRMPYVVVHLINVPPADASLDGVVTNLIDGEFQFDSVADDANNGALTARQLNRAVRELLQDFDGTLSDGTVIRFYDVSADFDDNYEVGGTSYIFRSVLRLKAFYTEGPNSL
jgi:hypothetical protein